MERTAIDDVPPIIRGRVLELMRERGLTVMDAWGVAAWERTGGDLIIHERWSVRARRWLRRVSGRGRAEM